MVSPISLRARLGCATLGLTIDGIEFLGHIAVGLSGNDVEHVLRTQGETTVDEYRAELVLGYGRFEKQKGAQLAVAILFDDVAVIVIREKGFDVGMEGE